MRKINLFSFIHLSQEVYGRLLTFIHSFDLDEKNCRIQKPKILINWVICLHRFFYCHHQHCGRQRLSFFSVLIRKNNSDKNLNFLIIFHYEKFGIHFLLSQMATLLKCAFSFSNSSKKKIFFLDLCQNHIYMEKINFS